MIIRRRKWDEPAAVTEEALFWRRRDIVRAAAAAGLLTLARPANAAALQIARKKNLAADEEPTPWKLVTGYNNFYEFGTGKEDPAAHSAGFQPLPWTLKIDGEVHRPQTIDVGDLLSRPLEQRIYRFRCVEAWSMVVPWDGIPLATLLRQAEPTSHARYVAFETVLRPDEMPGQRSNILDWPYREGLRLDEAMHDLTFLALGVYGKPLPNQNGAPVRLVVPWKYGFKSIKSIVRIRLVRERPATTWNMRAPDEYGFFANVNPDVDHPRWSQKSERRLGDFFRRPTLPFNGYAEQVAGLYRGMDLRRNF